MTDRIIAVRKELKLSQRAFGERLGVSRDVICNIEYGRVQPKTLFLRHMCQEYKINFHWLKTGEGEMFTETLVAANNSKLNEALAIFQDLQPEFQDYALEQIKNLVKLQERLQSSETIGELGKPTKEE